MWEKQTRENECSYKNQMILILLVLYHILVNSASSIKLRNAVKNWTTIKKRQNIGEREAKEKALDAENKDSLDIGDIRSCC